MSVSMSKRTKQRRGTRMDAKTVLEKVLEERNTDNESDIAVMLESLRKSKPTASNKEEILADKVAELLLPKLTQAIDTIVEQRMNKVLDKMTEWVEKEITDALDKVERSNLLLRYEIDRQEQYSRRETVKITGLKEEDDENTEERVLKVFSEIGCEVKKEDISTVHRNGRRQDGERGGRQRGPRPVLVKFTSRKTKAAVMKNRAKLKDTRKEEYKKVYLNDDLTPLRAKLLHMAKGVPQVERASTSHDGKIICTMKKRPGETTAKTVVVDTPDDLFKLGVNEVDYSELGLSNFVFGDAE